MNSSIGGRLNLGSSAKAANNGLLLLGGGGMATLGAAASLGLASGCAAAFTGSGGLGGVTGSGKGREAMALLLLTAARGSCGLFVLAFVDAAIAPVLWV